MNYENLWIIVDDGDTFEGNIGHWEDVFFSNASIEDIVDFCMRNNMKVQFSKKIGVK